MIQPSSDMRYSTGTSCLITNHDSEPYALATEMEVGDWVSNFHTKLVDNKREFNERTKQNSQLALTLTKLLLVCWQGPLSLFVDLPCSVKILLYSSNLGTVADSLTKFLPIIAWIRFFGIFKNVRPESYPLQKCHFVHFYPFSEFGG